MTLPAVRFGGGARIRRPSIQSETDTIDREHRDGGTQCADQTNRRNLCCRQPRGVARGVAVREQISRGARPRMRRPFSLFVSRTKRGGA